MWTIKDISKALGVKVAYSVNMDICGVSIDTRTIKKNELFIAIKGDNFDGNEFTLMAEKQGAAIIIAEKENPKVTIPQIIVTDSYQALIKLAIYRRDHTSAKIIAITGSIGKTSCKSVLYDILSLYDNSYASIGNYNNHIGLPLSLVNMPHHTKFAVFELGMNHKGEIKYLSELLRPDLAWITMVNDAHIGNFNNEAEIIDAKAEIFSGLNKSGIILLNNSDKNFYKLHDIALNLYHHNSNLVKNYGDSNNGDLIIKKIELNQKKQFIVTFLFEQQTHQLTFNFHNLALIKLLLGIIVLLSELSLNYKRSLQYFSKIKPITGRGNIINSNHITIIDDSYNANPASMNAAFDNLNILGEISGNRTVAIIGTMLELGKNSKAKHLALKDSLIRNNIKKVITIGAYMQDLYNILPPEKRIMHYDKAQGNLDNITSHLKKGDVVLVKASRSIKADLIVKHLNQH